MRFLLKVRMPNDAGNAAIQDPEFGTKLQGLLKEIGAEAAYFGPIDGQRGCYVFVNMEDASQLPAIGEPFFLWLKADLEFVPVMLPEDLGKAGPDIGRIVQQYGSR